MNYTGIDKLYIDLEKHILLAQRYTEIPYLSFIIKGCRLKPNEYVFENNKKLVLFRKWHDEFSNTLEIDGKDVNIIYNDLSLDRKKIICTDLYYGLPLKKIAKMSKLVHICAGIDEDNFEETYFLTFLGMDNYLRSYLYMYGEWETVSPLLLGMKLLYFMSRNTRTTELLQKNNYKIFPMACASGQSYLSYIPYKKEFIPIIEKKYERLAKIFR